jgi:hypothetical protein
MKIILIMKKMDKQDVKSPVVFLDLVEGQKCWEEIKFQTAEDKKAQLYCDCELWQGEPKALQMVDNLSGHYV